MLFANKYASMWVSNLISDLPFTNRFHCLRLIASGTRCTWTQIVFESIHFWCTGCHICFSNVKTPLGTMFLDSQLDYLKIRILLVNSHTEVKSRLSSRFQTWKWKSESLDGWRHDWSITRICRFLSLLSTMTQIHVILPIPTDSRTQ